ncbi:hypothetical protein C8J57DRAFT_1285898 [Mycena rebaudengoi]|nr:hypothetical protein C8J57DRAFT_1285898 [Mycena rebaudengoi]
MPALKLCGFAPLLFRNTVHYVAAHPAFSCAALSRTYAIKTGGGLGTSIEVAAADTRSVVTTVQPGETDLTAASRLSPMPYPRVCFLPLLLSYMTCF